MYVYFLGLRRLFMVIPPIINRFHRLRIDFAWLYAGDLPVTLV